MIWIWIAVRIIANPFSNVLQKRLTQKTAHPLVIICVTHGLLSLACAPLFLFFSTRGSTEFWVNISICSLLAVAGNALIVQALKLSDLSILGPINAWKPVVSLFPGMFLLREFPGAMGLCGIALIVGGSYFVVGNAPEQPVGEIRQRLLFDRGVQFRFGALVLSAIEAVFLKTALVKSSPVMTFAVWSIAGFVIALGAVAAAMGANLFATPFPKAQGVPPARNVRHESKVAHENKTAYFMLFATTGLMQLATLVTFEQMQVGYALALFQTSALISVVLGRKVFNEPHFLERLVGAAVMVLGAILIIVGR